MARQVVSYNDLDTVTASFEPSSSSIVQSTGGGGPSLPETVSANATTQPPIGPAIPTHLQRPPGCNIDSPDDSSLVQEAASPLKKRKVGGRDGETALEHGGGSTGEIKEAVRPMQTRSQDHHQKQGNNSANNKKHKGKRKNNKRIAAGVYGGNGLWDGYRGGTVTSVNGSMVGSAGGSNIQHWDDPGEQGEGIAYEDGEVSNANMADESWAEVEMELEDDEDESRELTRDEIWDDSALVAAWDAANEEYEAMHGKNKNWKKDRIHKSPLWYNIPSDKLKDKKEQTKPTVVPRGVSPSSRHTDQVEDDSNCRPHDFNSYVPQHDASLDFSVPPQPPHVPAYAQNIISGSAAHYTAMMTPHATVVNHPVLSSELGTTRAESTVSADEAFSRALGAMYWTGYWTAMYHNRRSDMASAATNESANNIRNIDEEYQEEERLDHEETEALISTQR